MASSTDHPGRAGAGTTRFLSFSAPTLRRMIGNLGWPILLKELRADSRKSRFFIVHFLCVLAIAIGVMSQIVLQGEEGGMTSVQLGRSLFDTFFLIQFLVVAVVFPALTSSAFAEERARKTLPLLLTTDMLPGEIVTGKFLATSAYCLLTIFATVPLLAVSTLLGGVKMNEVAVAYAVLLGHTALISMLGVYVSTWTTSGVRSTLVVYTIVLAYLAVAFVWVGIDISDQHAAAGDRTVVSLLLERFMPAGVDSAAAGAVAFLIDLVLGAGFSFAYLFLLAVNRIQPLHADRSSSLRLLTVLLLFVLLLAAVVQPPPAVSTSAALVAAGEGIIGWHVTGVLAVLTLSALVFASEPLEISRRVRRRFARFRGALAPVRLLMPGTRAGLLFTMIASAISVALLLVCIDRAHSWIEAFSGPGFLPEQERWRTVIERWLAVTTTFPVMIVTYGSLAFCLSCAGFTRGYCLLTVVFTFVITLLAPVIILFQGAGDGLLSLYYLSPITLWDSLTAEPLRYPEGPAYTVLGGMAVIDFARVLHAATGVLLVAAGVWIAKRRGVWPGDRGWRRRSYSPPAPSGEASSGTTRASASRAATT